MFLERGHSLNTIPQRDFFVIKTQLISTNKERGAFVFDDKEIVGTVNLAQVPTTILAPLT